MQLHTYILFMYIILTFDSTHGFLVPVSVSSRNQNVFATTTRTKVKQCNMGTLKTSNTSTAVLSSRNDDFTMPSPTTLISDIPKDKRGIGVGIDLGTTNSAISILNEEGIPYLIKIDGKSTISSVVTLQAATTNQDGDNYDNNNDDDHDTRIDPNHKETKSYQVLVGEVLSNERKQDYQHDCFTYRHVKRVIGMGTEVGECI